MLDKIIYYNLEFGPTWFELDGALKSRAPARSTRYASERIGSAGILHAPSVPQSQPW